ncbi:MAG: phosphatase PAP2 family protein [Chloroflexi bacterium]|nr:phosphatase PAP2 family protein [Chloroflexota bacterium]
MRRSRSSDRAADRSRTDGRSEDQGHPPADTSLDPTVAARSPASWRAWLLALLVQGRQRLAAFGLLLVLGFILAVGASFIFAELADEVSEGETLPVDMAALLWLRQFQSGALDVAAQVVSAFGSEGLAVILVVIIGTLIWQRRWGAAISLFIVTAGAQFLNDVLKLLFQRTRPAPVDFALLPGQSFSFPSGHAMVSAAAYGFLGYLVWRLLRGWLRWTLIVVLAVLVVLIGLSRMYLGVHYLTDVVAGYLAGFIWVDAVVIAGHVLNLRRSRPAASSDDAGQPAAVGHTPAPVERDASARPDANATSTQTGEGDGPTPPTTSAPEPTRRK